MLRRRMYIVGLLLLLFFAAVIAVFVVKNDSKVDYRGTLVMDYNQEESS